MEWRWWNNDGRWIWRRRRRRLRNGRLRRWFMGWWILSSITCLAFVFLPFCFYCPFTSSFYANFGLIIFNPKITQKMPKNQKQSFWNKSKHTPLPCYIHQNVVNTMSLWNSDPLIECYQDQLTTKKIQSHHSQRIQVQLSFCQHFNQKNEALLMQKNSI